MRLPILRCQLHHSQRFPVAFRLRLAEVSNQTLLRVTSFLMANNRHGPSVKFAKPGNDRLVVSITTVAMQFDKFRKEKSDKIQRIRTLLVTRDLRTLPRPQMGVKFAPQFRDLLADTIQLGVRIRVARKVTQLLDIFLQTLDLLFTPDFRFARVLLPTGLQRP